MSSAFESALKSTLNNETTLSENGAVMFAHTQSKLLDINFATSSLRNKSEADIQKMFSDAFYEDKLLALKWLFMCRDVRGGMGERRTFRICMKWLAAVRPDLAEKLVSLVSTYGRYDDLLCLISMDDNDKVQKQVINVIDTQWSIDIEHMKAEKPISLLAKWLPSVNTSSDETVKLARYICKKLDLTERQYRKTLSAMRKYLNVIEQKMSSKEWSSIDYSTVPSKANIKYNSAFLRNDEDRRREFLGKLETGEAKINAATSFPSDIVHAYVSNNDGRCYGRPRTCNVDQALEAMWKALPNVAVNGNVMAVVDGSGSMTVQVGGTSLTALEVANALGLYCAEHCTGPFKDKFITFSENPQYVDFSKASSLAERLRIAFSHDECASTNIYRTFELVLQTAIKHNLKQEDIPTLVILSDMEFDCGADFSSDGSGNRYSCYHDYNADKTALMQKVAKRWEDAGYKLPRTIWWNIYSRTGSVPMQQNDLGVVLCSGYSQSQFKMIASNKTDPYDVLVESLNTERYAPIEAAVKDIV